MTPAGENRTRQTSDFRRTRFPAWEPENQARIDGKILAGGCVKIRNNSPNLISNGGGRAMLKEKQKRLLRELARVPLDELVSQKELARRAGIDITTVNAYLKLFID